MSGLLFADANAVFSYGKYVIVGAPLDITSTHRRGSDRGPAAIRNESYTFESFLPDLGIDLADIPIHDMGDLPMKAPKEEISEAVRNILDNKKVPIFMGGEHSISPYIVSEFEDVSVVVFDAHLDYRDNWKGDKNNHACATRRMDEAISPETILPIGIRSICKSEYEDAKKRGLDYITADKAREIGTQAMIDLLDDIMPGNIYISVDIDGIDPAFAPGVGTPEPFGLEPVMVRDIIQHLAPRILGFDVVEVCPPADNGNTAALAAKLMRQFIGAREKSMQ